MLPKFHMALVDEDLEDFSVDGLLKQSGKLSACFLERREAGNMPLPPGYVFPHGASCAGEWAEPWPL